MTTSDSRPASETVRPTLLGGADTCRLTVAGPGRRADLTVPATVSTAELLPVLLRRLVDEHDRNQPWVLQRLGEEPLSPESTAELLDLRHGDVLYLRPADRALPPVEFDDVAVGVAVTIGARTDRWRPAFTRRLLLGLACLSLAAFVYGMAGVTPQWRLSVCLGIAALALTVGCIATNHLLDDPTVSLITGLSGCALAALAGLSVGHGVSGVTSPGHQGVLLGSLCAVVAASGVLAAGRVLIMPFGAVVATAAMAVLGSWLEPLLHWNAVRVSAVMSVAVFMLSTRSLRVVLRMARLRAPQLPRNAEELQQDIEPEPGERLARRAALAVAYLDSMTISASLLFAVCFIQLSRLPHWIGWVLTAVFSAAVLLRARDLTGLWQRTFLAVSGTLGLLLVVTTLAGRIAPDVRVVALFGLLAVAGLLLIGAQRLPYRRLLPIWGHTADRLETLTAAALVPLLLQLLHVYGYVRGLIG